jgi:capsular polysaccharide biosynthesis protein
MSTASAIPYLAPPTACEPLATIGARAGGRVTAGPWPGGGGAGGRFEYALPAHATEEMRAYLRRGAGVIVEYGPGMIAQVAGGRVFGSGVVLSPDGRSIARDVSLDFGKRPDDHWLLTYRKIRPPIPLAGRVAVVATALGAGYSHWLLEELPRLLELRRGGVGADKLIAHTRSAFAREALALHGWMGEVIEPARLGHYACEHLIVPSLPGPDGWPTPTLVEALENAVAPWLRTETSPWGERLYISRALARRRRVANEAELWAHLESRGFAKLHLEELTWREQIAAFRAARVIVAPHGAGLANLAFCRPGARVVEFFHRAYVNPVFWRLAAVKGLDYRPVVAAEGPPLAQVLACNREEIFADIGQVLTAAG